MTTSMYDQARGMLTGNIIPFWKGLRDNEYGGFYGFMDFDLNLDKKAVKGGILNSRILWFFSSAAMALEDKSLLEEARHAYKFLTDVMLDKENGGVYWSVGYDGAPADTTKHTYNQAFAVYALSAYYDASRDEEALKHSWDIFHLIEGKCTDEFGYLEAFDREFNALPNDKLSGNGLMAEKTMNTLLHVLEGYSNLFRSTGDKRVEAAMERIFGIVLTKVYNPALRRQEVFFDREMNSLGNIHSFGHDIEASWLLDWGAAMLSDQTLAQRVYAMTSELAKETKLLAYDENSLWNERAGGVDDTNRIWWVEAEAVLGFLNEARKNPEDTSFMEAARDTLAYIQKYIVDPRPGSEWFGRVNAAGEPIHDPILEPWKCPYHNGRMCIEIMKRNE
ncbi:MAG: AGE family epimerase/isomerase [Oscillospiraceae bacterium]